jgi:hypothetical protein
MFFRNKNRIKKPVFRKIINAFIYAGVGFIFILLLVFGFTQTKTFREWLKETVIEEVNLSTNGKLELERIDGTILTSIILHNTIYTLDQDTLINAEKIELRTSPLKLIFKIIYIRKLEINNAQIAFLKDETGMLNISKIVTLEEKETVEEFETSSGFTFKFEISALILENVDFLIQSEAKRNSREYYDHADFDDLRLKNINLNMYAYADFTDEDFILKIDRIQFEPNLKNFLLRNLSIDLMMIGDETWLRELRIETATTDIKLKAAVSGYNFLGDNEDKRLEDAQIKLDLLADSFNFDDLSTFIEATNLLKGDISTEININGSLTDLSINQLRISGENTELNGQGRLSNILNGGDMDISFRITDSYVDQVFANNLLHTIDLPVYSDYGLLKIDTLYYEGKPLNFNSGINLTTERGSINLIAFLDLEEEDLLYDINFSTINLDLQPVAGIPSRLNVEGGIKGSGTDPERMQAEMKLTAERSNLFETSLQSLDFSADISQGEITTGVNFVTDGALGNMDVFILMNDFENPVYNFKTDIKGLDLSAFVKDSTMKSNLNFTLNGEGENFSLEELNLFAVLEVDSSQVNGYLIEKTMLITDIRSDPNEKIINIISDLADITFTGNFEVEDIVSLISIETTVLASTIQNIINTIQPPDPDEDNIDNKFAEEFSYPDISTDSLNADINISYLIEFKNFELLSLILGNSDIEIDGEITGDINTFPDSVAMSVNAKIEYFKYWDGFDLFHFSQLNLFSKLNDKISDPTFDGFALETNLTANRIFAGAEIENIDFNIFINGTNADIDLEAIINDNTTIKLAGLAAFKETAVKVTLDNLFLGYNEFNLSNDGFIEIAYSDNQIDFTRFILTHDPGSFEISGSFSLNDEENLSVKFSDFSFKDLATKLMGLSPQITPDAIFNLTADYKGTAISPVMDLNLSIDSVRYNELILGSFDGNLNYLNELMTIGIRFNELAVERKIPNLNISGTVPVNLAMNGEDILINNREIDIKFIADKLDLNIFNLTLPMMRNLKGELESDIHIFGTFDDLNSSGNFNIKDASFILAENNLEYNFGLELNFENDKATLKNLYLANSPGTRGGGRLRGGGQLTHQNFVPQSSEFYLNGDLKVLSQDSRAVSPTMYGDISIRTIEDIKFIQDEFQNKLSANILIKRGANLTYSPIQSAFSNENDKFIYVFAGDETLTQQDLQIDSLIILAETLKEDSVKSAEIPFDLDIKITIEDDFRTVFVLSREFKQNLTAYLGGTFDYVVIGGETIVHGELELMDGSKLDFIKSFQAQGSIQFISEIDNPFLDITASYQSYYNPDTLRSASSESEIMIQIKLEGPAKNLSTNFIRNEESITVFKKPVGRGQYEVDATKDASDAMMFIIMGKFPEDATSQETNLAVSTAASLAGSIVGGFLNEQLGDYVRSFQVSQVGEETKFSLVGRAGSFRYEFGGTSQMFQDLGRANLKIEYPIPVTPGLIIRVERREPIYESTTASEMINELGLKYSFEF